MTVKDRIKLYCKAEGLTISAFEESIGVSNGYVNAISKSIGLDKLNTIIEKYSNLNIEWLLTGKGGLIKTKCSKKDAISDEDPSPDKPDSKDKQNNPKKQDNSTIISQLLDTIREQAEEIGRLKVLINDLERRIHAAEDTHTTAAAG